MTINRVYAIIAMRLRVVFSEEAALLKEIKSLEEKLEKRRLDPENEVDEVSDRIELERLQEQHRQQFAAKGNAPQMSSAAPAQVR